MTKPRKVAAGIGAGIVLAAIIAFAISQANKNVVLVQTGAAVREDLTSLVSASGEIKPKVYVNVGANAFGKIVKLYVQEGERVKAGQMLAQLENVQSEADVASTRAQLAAARTDALASQAAIKTAQADLERAQATYEKAKLDYHRAEGLWGQGLIPRSEYDADKAAFDTAAAGLDVSRAGLAQAKAQQETSLQRIRQYQASLVHANDVLSKTVYTAPFAGVITNLPVREGETVVVGIQNSPGSTLMTLADMSVITAEVQVDETDIVNVKMGQPAEVTIDAIPKKVFPGVVTDIGNNAIVRSTGLATIQTTTGSQEAKDFKVVVTLKDPPANLRPGLSATAKITTAVRSNIVGIPIQALTVRQRGDLENKPGKGAVQAASSSPSPRDKEEIQGVFVVRNKRAQFVPVDTGITGVTDAEVLHGIQPGDEIITGSYKVLRTLRNGASVKVDNSAPPPSAP